MRLIDADKLQSDFEELRASDVWYSTDLDVLDIVNEVLISTQPTVCDIEKIIQEMEQYRDFITIQARPFVDYCISTVRRCMNCDA